MSDGNFRVGDQLEVGQKWGYREFARIGNGKSASLQQSSGHCWGVVQDQSC